MKRQVPGPLFSFVSGSTSPSCRRFFLFKKNRLIQPDREALELSEA
jgi:hypothetical protein